MVILANNNVYNRSWIKISEWLHFRCSPLIFHDKIYQWYNSYQKYRWLTRSHRARTYYWTWMAKYFWTLHFRRTVRYSWWRIPSVTKKWIDNYTVINFIINYTRKNIHLKSNNFYKIYVLLFYLFIDVCKCAQEWYVEKEDNRFHDNSINSINCILKLRRRKSRTWFIHWNLHCSSRNECCRRKLYNLSIHESAVSL